MPKKEVKKKKISAAIKSKKKSVSHKKEQISVSTSRASIELPKEAKKHDEHYITAIGRRKEAIARIRFYSQGNGEIVINNKDWRQYFPYFEYQNSLTEPLRLCQRENIGKLSVKVIGGGLRGQAESVRLGISRILLKIDKNYRPILKANGLLTRDPRVKERKKYGLKKARRAPQWQKR